MRIDSSRLFELIQLRGSFQSCETRILISVLCSNHSRSDFEWNSNGCQRAGSARTDPVIVVRFDFQQKYWNPSNYSRNWSILPLFTELFRHLVFCESAGIKEQVGILILLNTIQGLYSRLGSMCKASCTLETSSYCKTLLYYF